MYLLAWTSGHEPPRTMYYSETESGHWRATEKCIEAKRFKTKNDAIQTWRSKHCWPDEAIYKRAWASGVIRVEKLEQGDLLL